MILIMLTTLYKAISDPHKMPQPAMSIVLQLINVEAIPNAVECILQDDSESSLEEAFNTLCDWLTRWTWTANLGPSVLCFMQGLANRQHYDILVDVTLKYVDKLFMILILPDPRDTVGPVVLHMLSSTQNSAEVFRKVGNGQTIGCYYFLPFCVFRLYRMPRMSCNAFKRKIRNLVAATWKKSAPSSANT